MRKWLGGETPLREFSSGNFAVSRGTAWGILRYDIIAQPEKPVQAWVTDFEKNYESNAIHKSPILANIPKLLS
jgi:hypothetical protein